MSQLFAGSRVDSGYVDAVGEAARFDYPAGLEADDTYLYVTEYVGARVRRIDPITAEVTTAAVLPVGSRPYGIYRNPATGNFWVACAGDYTIRVYASDWSLDHVVVPTISGPGTSAEMYYVTVDAAEANIYATGFPAASDTFDNKLWWFDAVGTELNWVFLASFADPAGLIIIGSWLYYVYTRFANRGLWRIPLDLTGLELVHAADYDAARQLHLIDADTLAFAYGPSSYSDPIFTGGGAQYYDLLTDAYSDAAPGRHTNPRQECDFLPVFGKKFVTSSNITLSTGGDLYETYAGPHSIEILRGFLPQVHFIK